MKIQLFDKNNVLVKEIERPVDQVDEVGVVVLRDGDSIRTFVYGPPRHTPRSFHTAWFVEIDHLMENV